MAWNLIRRFQSTLPARGATGRAVRIGADGRDFNPRSPHGERRKVFKTREEALVISIHAPRTGSDLAVEISSIVSDISIHAPRTGSDKIKKGARNGAGISIHAPRTGSDTLVWS